MSHNVCLCFKSWDNETELTHIYLYLIEDIFSSQDFNEYTDNIYIVNCYSDIVNPMLFCKYFVT